MQYTQTVERKDVRNFECLAIQTDRFESTRGRNEIVQKVDAVVGRGKDGLAFH